MFVSEHQRVMRLYPSRLKGLAHDFSNSRAYALALAQGATSVSPAPSASMAQTPSPLADSTGPNPPNRVPSDGPRARRVRSPGAHGGRTFKNARTKDKESNGLTEKTTKPAAETDDFDVEKAIDDLFEGMTSDSSD